MFNNIDRKIKGLAVFYTIVGIIGSIIGAIFYWVNDAILIGFLILIFGILASWIGSFMLYGFGELISKSSNIEERIKKLQFLTVCQNSNQNNKYNDLLCKVNEDIVNKLFKEHLIQVAHNEDSVKEETTNVDCDIKTVKEETTNVDCNIKTVKEETTNADCDIKTIKEISTNNILIRFKIANFQPSYNDKLIGRVLQIEHVTNADISPEGILTCYYDDTIKTPSDVLSLKKLIKSQIAKKND